MCVYVCVVGLAADEGTTIKGHYNISCTTSAILAKHEGMTYFGIVRWHLNILHQLT